MNTIRTGSLATDIAGWAAVGPFVVSDFACQELHKYGQGSLHALWTYPLSITILLGNVAIQPLVSAVSFVAGLFFGVFGCLTCSSEWLGKAFTTEVMAIVSCVLCPVLLANRIFNPNCLPDDSYKVRARPREEFAEEVEEFVAPGPSSLPRSIQAMLQISPQTEEDNTLVEGLGAR